VAVLVAVLFPRGPLPHPVKYADLAAAFERLEATPGRLGMTSILVDLLGRVPPSDMAAVVRLLQGAVAADWEGLEVGLAEKQILKVLSAATGTGLEEATARYREAGDLGLAAEVLFGRTKRKQATLRAASDLAVQEVFETLVGIARTGGTGSQDKKQKLLAKVLHEASPLEARYVVRTVAGRLRLGVADMTFLDALASWHEGKGVRSVTEMEADERAKLEDVRRRLERAYDLRSDLAAVADELAKGGMKAVDRMGIQLGTPVRPMAAERLKTLPEILEKMGGRVAMEYKYDGLRIQAHIPKKGEVSLFSRRLENLTGQFPDVVKALEHFPGRDCIVEGEAVALDEEGRLRPFQDISRRRGRKTDLEKVSEEVPITLFLFDLLALDGESTMERSYAERRAQLAEFVPKKGPIRMSTLQEAKDAEGMESFFDQAVADGAEGIMCKDPTAPYKAGSRGFAWIKFKTDYTEALVDTMDLVCIGAFHGRGRRAGWYGALLMAAYDPDTQTWPSVCKLGTGFDDATLESLKGRFKAHASDAQPKGVDSVLVPDVWFDPHVVMEVQAAELTLSPIHRAGWDRVKPGAGLAARFPRFTGRWRDDKGPRQATTVEELLRLRSTKGEART
jgi:DNA ligase-1